MFGAKRERMDKDALLSALERHASTAVWLKWTQDANYDVNVLHAAIKDTYGSLHADDPKHALGMLSDYPELVSANITNQLSGKEKAQIKLENAKQWNKNAPRFLGARQRRRTQAIETVAKNL